jgi:hypothetical protein
MTDDAWDDPHRSGAVPSTAGRYVSPAPMDPLGLRARLMLETSSHLMAEPNWPYRQTTVEMRSQGDEEGIFRLFGANHPDSIRRVAERQLDISIMNPSAILSMAHRGVGLFSEPMNVALIAVIPHADQLGFAVSQASGLTSLGDIREKRFPLRLSVRGSLDLSTVRLVELVLRAHGFGYDDILAWGGSVSYDQPMPNDDSRLGRAARGELDAIFEEGVMLWANEVEAAGLRFLDLGEGRLTELETLGFRRGSIERSLYDRLPADVRTVDFSGWPIYTRADAPDLLIRLFCEGLEARKSAIPWHVGPARQQDLPLARMVTDSAETPMDVPLHPAAQDVWTRLGYLNGS